MSDIKVSKSATAKDKKHAEITIEGELTLQNVGELKKTIQKNITGFESINIKADNITYADLSFIQILESLKKQYKDKKLKLEINVVYPYDVKTLLANAGFEVGAKT